MDADRGQDAPSAAGQVHYGGRAGQVHPDGQEVPYAGPAGAGQHRADDRRRIAVQVDVAIRQHVYTRTNFWSEWQPGWYWPVRLSAVWVTSAT